MVLRIGIAAVSVVFLCSTSLSADIILPIGGADAQVLTRAYDGSGVQGNFELTLGTSGTTTDGTASATADLTTGLLGFFFEGTGAPSATVIAYEFLTFSADANVSWSYAIDGTLSNLTTGGAVQASPQVLFYDVTGMEPDFFTVLGNGFQFLNTAPFSNTSEHVVVHGSGFDTGIFGDPQPTFILSEDGSDVPVAMNLAGTIAVEDDRLYALAIILAGGTLVSGTAQREADFSHTGAFTFTDLGGAEFTSSSDAFLSAVPAPVPEPGTLSLLGLGLAALARRRRKNQAAKTT